MNACYGWPGRTHMTCSLPARIRAVMRSAGFAGPRPHVHAALAQLVEHIIRNVGVIARFPTQVYGRNVGSWIGIRVKPL